MTALPSLRNVSEKHTALTSKSEIKMSWLDWENLENMLPHLMKAACPGH